METHFEPYMGHWGIKQVPKGPKYGAKFLQPYSPYLVRERAYVRSCIPCLSVHILLFYQPNTTKQKWLRNCWTTILMSPLTEWVLLKGDKAIVQQV